TGILHILTCLPLCLPQRERIRAAYTAVYDEHATGREQRDVAGNGRPCDRIDDGVDPAAAGQLGNAGGDILTLAVDDVIGPEIAGEARLCFAARNADHEKPCRLGEIDERVSHAAGSGVDEHALAISQL